MRAPARAALLIAGGTFLAAHAALTFLLPVSVETAIRFWGGNALRYLPSWAAILAYAAAAGVVLAIALGREANHGHRNPAIDGRKSGSRLHPVLVGPAVVLAVTAVFILLRSRYGFLGDNLLRVREAEQGAAAPNELGVMTLYHFLVQLGRRFGFAGARQIFAAVSIAAGLIYAATAWALGRRVASSAPAGIIFLGLITAGSVQLFCGYLEVYPLILAWGFVTVYFALLAAQGRAPVWVPLLLLAVQVILHRVAVFWAPAAFAPILIRAQPLESDFTRPARRFTLALVGVGALAGLILGGRSSLLLPLLPGAAQHYTLFSPSHLSDYLNAQFLGSTTAFLLAPLSLLVWLRQRRVSAASWITLWAWLVPAMGLFFFRPILGGADWDVLALAAPFGWLFAVTVLADQDGLGISAGAFARSAHGLYAAAPRRWLQLAVLLAAFNTVPWLFVQAGDASIARTVDLIRTDRADYFQGHPAPLHLAFVFAANGLPQQQRQELQRGAQEFPDDPRYPYNLAVIARARGDWPEAETEALAAFRLQEGYLPPLDVLYDAYKARGAKSDQAMVGRAILEAYDSQREAVERYLPPARIAQIRREVEGLPSNP